MTRVGVLVVATLAALAGPVAAAEEFYFLKLSGKGAPISRLALNGAPVVSGTIIALTLPVQVTRALKNGANALEVEFTSDPHEGLIVVVERRRKGSPQHDEVAKIAVAKNETQGRSVRKSVTFTVKPPPAAKPLVLADADREQIRRLIQAHYEALARRDADATVRLYDAAVSEARTVYPEGVDLHRKVMDDSVRKMLADPNFKMRPLRLENLRYQAEGNVVVVERTDRQPIFESEEVDVAQAKTKLAPPRLFFQRAGGRWHTTVPVLVL